MEESAEERLRNYDTSWLWELSAPEKLFLIPGYIGAAIVGIGYPLLGYFLAEIIAVFYLEDPTQIRSRAAFWAYMFILIGYVYVYIYIHIYL
jgi:hypothetical protein